MSINNLHENVFGFLLNINQIYVTIFNYLGEFFKIFLSKNATKKVYYNLAFYSQLCKNNLPINDITDKPTLVPEDLFALF